MIVSRSIPPENPFWVAKLNELQSAVFSLERDSSWDQKMKIQTCLDQMPRVLQSKEDPASLTQLRLRCKDLTDLKTYLANAEASGMKRSRSGSTLILSIDSIIKLFQTQLLELATSINERLATLIPHEKLMSENGPFFAKIFKTMTSDQREQFFSSLETIKYTDRFSFLKSIIFFLGLKGYHGEAQTHLLLESLKLGNSGLHLAILFNQFIEEMLNNPEIDVDLQNAQGCTPLHFARSSAIVSLLISKGADSRRLDLFGNSVYMLQKQHGLEPLPFIAPDPLGHTLKMAALVWGLTGSVNLPHQRTFRLDGGISSMALVQLIGNLSSIPTLVRDAFLAIPKVKTYGDTMYSIWENKLTIIPCGFTGHCIFLIFYKNLLLICNRGTGSEAGKLRCYQINPAKILPSTLKTISQLRPESKHRAVSIYYNALPAYLAEGSKPREITNIFSPLLEPKKQKVGNCLAASAKLAIRGALAALAFKEHGDTLNDAVATLVLAYSKAATRELREKTYFTLKKEANEIEDPSIKTQVLKLFALKRREYEIYDPGYDPVYDPVYDA